jgi:glycosyltransferase involved in cell wall biosynthesis
MPEWLLRMPNPLVSIGVPVFNAERFLPRALDSLVSQTLTDFELIISDNASTDRTPEICEEYLRRDPRIRYIRQPVNIGAPRNWNAVVHEACGVFFKWASGTDYCAAEMLEKCIEVMQADPGIALCYGKTQLVDEHEQPIELYEHDRSFNQSDPSERFAQVLSRLWMNNMQSGVFRLDTLRRTRLDRLYPTGDLVLMAELALYGRFHMIDEVLLFRRHTQNTFTAMLTPLERQQVYEPEATAPVRFIAARRYLDYFFSISRAPIPLTERLRAYKAALRLVIWARGRLLRELLSALPGARRTE